MSDQVWRDILYTIGFDDEEVDEIEKVGAGYEGGVQTLIWAAIDRQVWGTE
ncbi:hypothetical protein ACFYU5_18855 [Nocardia aobensis]|uniref:Uncharacterized protein n=1 Tax=Nocardia aobensis TaxID=257277 RepID=A0ABW6P5P8_9NOCA